ncbi:uncharacterized protein LOC132755218 isoform X2 [Ruditapes philippinarum]|uniref:uncharacterized protein LOC132755218 isoform X2 n=1 Tax=Ruditapes philippinarum TaxID=129788 RepID=UPI00295B5A98|nr:uncharacterized protein LOC132755218 isoform X2 [Ruditapes philippinarum]
MQQMNSNSLLIVCSCLIFARFVRVAATGTQTHYNVRIGAAVNFHLPDVSKCAKFVLTDPFDNIIVTVYNMSYTETDRKYVDRSIIGRLDNGTWVLTLHNILQSDNGTFLIKPSSGQSPDLCWRIYVLTTYDIPTVGSMAYQWTDWQSWGACSVTCGYGVMTRVRQCHDDKAIIEDRRCTGSSKENRTCSISECEPTVGSMANQWTTWQSWGACSVTCGYGVMTRERQCHDNEAIIEDQRCTGSSKENTTCSISECEHIDETSPGSGNLGADEKVVQLPLYSIVGAGAGVFILILIIVICVLVMQLKKRDSFKRGKPSKKANIPKKESIISFSSQGISGVHVYDEIDDAKSQRMSVVTIDNPYVTLPKSPRGQHATRNNAVTYCNIEENVFLFDNSGIGGQSENRKASCAYQNTESNPDQFDSNKLTVPRHMSVDSTGYLMPGTTMERAQARRNKKYSKEK